MDEINKKRIYFTSDRHNLRQKVRTRIHQGTIRMPWFK